MNSPLKVAIAGAGMISHHHLIAWSKLDNVRVVAVSDPLPEKAAIRASKFGIDAEFAEVEQMLDSVKPDALDIASPVGTHATIARMAAERGIAILCQKPVTETLDEAESLKEVAATVPFMVHENWRFRTPYRTARRWIQEGRIGIVHRFSITTESSGLIGADGEAAPALTRQPFFMTMPRLLIFEVLIHHLDLARTLCGELSVVAASATYTTNAVPGEDRAIIQLQGERKIGLVVGDYAVPGRSPISNDRVQIVGSSGEISFDGETLTWTGHGGETGTEVFDRAATYQSAFDNAICHFVDCLNSRTPFETSLDDNLRTLRLVDDAYRSLK